MADKFSLTAQINLQAPTSAETKKAFSKIKKDLKTVSTALNLTVTKKSANEAIKNINKNLKNLAVEVKLKSPTKATINKVLREINTKLKGKNVDVKININTGTATQEVNKLADATKRLATNNKAATQVKKIATETKNLGKESKKAASSAKNMADVFASALKVVLKYDIARRVFSGFTNVIEQGIGDAIKFERELVRIAQVSGQTITQLKGLEKTVFSLAKTLGVSSAALVKTGLILKQTGLSVKDTEIALRALAKTELAPTFDNIADTAETAVAAMRQFSIEASGLESLLSKINTVAANFAIEASDIGVAIKRAGGAFKAAGGSVEELIALMTSVRSTTRETAETIATGFRTIFTRLQRPTTIKFLRQFGIELTDLNGKFVGPFEAVKRLSNALQNLESTDLRFSAIVEQLGGFRQVSKVIPLIQQFGTAQQALNAQLKGSDSLAKDAAVAQQSLAVQMARVTAEVKELFQEMTQTSSFKALAGIALGVARAMTAMAKAITPLIPLLTLLFSFKAAAFIGGTLKSGGIKGLLGLGSSKGGGLPEAFAKGGWVPGSGSGDTVPAMLTPGEFVVRKSAAQAMGSQMEGINKYAKGGAVATKLGSRKATIQNKLVSKASEAFLQGKAINEKDNFVYNFEKQSYDNKDVANLIQKKWKTKGRQLKSLGDLFSKNTLTKGNTFEGLIGRSIGASKNKRPKNSPIDFIKNGNMHEVKFSDTQFPDEEFAAKALLERIAAPGSGTFKNFRDLEQSPLANIQNDPGINLGNIKAHVKAKGVKKAAIDKILGLSSPKKTTRSALSGAAALKLGSRKRVAMGGPISGPDTVPAMLTPGEFVVNKESAQAFGYGNLGKINKFNEGGAVGAAKGGFGAASGGLINLAIVQAVVGGLESLLDQFGLMNDSIKAFTTATGSVVATIYALGLASTKVAEKIGDKFGIKNSENKAAFGGFGGGGLKVGDEKIDAAQFNERNKTAAALQTALASQEESLVKVQNEFTAANTVREKALNENRKFEGIPQEESQAIAKRFHTAEKDIKIKEKAIEETRNQAETAKKSADAANKAATRMKALGVAAQAAGLAVAKLGEFVKNQALESIRGGQFEGQSTKAAVGGGVSKGALGGVGAFALGFGPLGIAVVALGAAAYGAATAFSEAEKLIAQVKFATSLAATTEVLEQFKNKQISVAFALIALEREVKTRAAVGGGFFGASPEDVAKGRQATDASAEVFVRSLGRSSESVIDFDRKLKLQAKTLILQGHVSSVLIKDIQKEITSRLKSEEALRKFAEATRKSTEALIKLQGISSIIDELKDNVSGFNNVISGISSIGSGAGPIGSVADIFNTTPRSAGGIGRFNSTIDRLGTSAESAGLDEFSGDVKSAAAVRRNVKGSLTRAGNFNVTAENTPDVIMQNIIDSLESEGSTLTTGVKKGLEDALINFTSIKGNEDEITKAIEEVTQETTDAYKNLATLIDDRNKFLKNAFAELSRLEGAFIQSSRKARDARIKAELEFNKAINTNTVSGPETDASVQARFLKRIENVLSPKGITDLKGLSGDVQARGGGIGGIGSELKDVTKQLAESQQNLADAEKRGEGKDKKAIEENKKLTSEFQALRNALGEYTDVQSRLAVINEELAQSQNKTKTLRELAINASFGTSEQKNEAQRLINAIAVAQSEGIQRVAPELQRQVIPLLSQLMGQKGEDQVNSELSANFKSFGLSADGIINASKKTIENAKRRDEVLRDAADALDQLAQNDQQRADIMATAIETQNNKFLEKLETLFINEQKRTVGLDFKVKDRMDAGLQESSRIVDEKNITAEQFQAIKNQNQAIDEFKNASDNLQSLLQFEGKLGLTEGQFREGNLSKELAPILGSTQFSDPRNRDPEWRGNLGMTSGERATYDRYDPSGQTGMDLYKDPSSVAAMSMMEKMWSGLQSAVSGGEWGGDASMRPVSDDEKAQNLIKTVKAIAAQKFETGALATFSKSTTGVEDLKIVEAIPKLFQAFDQGITDSRLALQRLAKQSPAIAQAAAISKSIRDRLETEFKGFANLDAFHGGVKKSAEELETLRQKLEILNGSPVFTQAEKQQQREKSAEELILKGVKSLTDLFKNPQAAPAPVKPNATESEFTGDAGLGRSKPSMENQRNLQRLTEEGLERRRLEAAPAPVKLNAIESELTGGAGFGPQIKIGPGQSNGLSMEGSLIPKVSEPTTMTLQPQQADAQSAGSGTTTTRTIEGGLKPLQSGTIGPPNKGADASQADFQAEIARKQKEAYNIGVNPTAIQRTTTIRGLQNLIDTRKRVTGQRGVTGATGTAGSTGSAVGTTSPMGGSMGDAGAAGANLGLSISSWFTDLLSGADTAAQQFGLKNMIKEGQFTGLGQATKESFANRGVRQGLISREGAGILTDDNSLNDQDALKHLVDLTKKNAEATQEFNKAAQSGDSLSVHDHHAVPLLSEILMVLKGEGGEASSGSVGGGAAFSIDTAGLNSSVEKFSKSIGELEKVMGSPLSIQVGGEINLNVNLNGAEFLRDAKDSFAQLAGQKITQGINNFIRDGLKNSGIGISSNWVGDESSNQRMGSNSSSGNTA
jgi:TP901 family phage tail tape measure protein